MVFNKIIFVFGLIALTYVSAFPAGQNEKTEVVEATTERIVNDDAVPVTTEVQNLILSDDITTILPVAVKSEVVKEAVVEEAVVPVVNAIPVIPPVPVVVDSVVVPGQKTASAAVVAEVVGEKIVPIVEIVEINSVGNTGIKTGDKIIPVVGNTSS